MVVKKAKIAATVDSPQKSTATTAAKPEKKVKKDKPKKAKKIKDPNTPVSKGGRPEKIKAPETIEEPPMDFVPLLEAGMPDLKKHFEHVFKKAPTSSNAEWMRNKLKKAYEAAGIAVKGDPSKRPMKKPKADKPPKEKKEKKPKEPKEKKAAAKKDKKDGEKKEKKPRKPKKDSDGPKKPQGRPVKIFIPENVPSPPDELPHPLHCNIKELRQHFQHIFNMTTNSGNAKWLKKKLCHAYKYDPEVVPPLPPHLANKPVRMARTPKEKKDKKDKKEGSAATPGKRQAITVTIKCDKIEDESLKKFQIKIRKDATVATLKKRIQEASKGKIHPRQQTLKWGKGAKSTKLEEDDKPMDQYGMGPDPTLSLNIKSKDEKQSKRKKKGDDDAKEKKPAEKKEKKEPKSTADGAKSARKPRMEEAELIALIDGVENHGANSWKAIKEGNPHMLETRTPQELKDKWRNLVKVCGVEGNDVGNGRICRLRTTLPKSKWALIAKLSDDPPPKKASRA
uniref:Myb-like domain-containing protein n=1 Tax=Prasinoderma coloniale TaxID=156133 RepID=A0A7R9TQA3_9VIRI